MFDQSIRGCQETETGEHWIEWLTVPGRSHNNKFYPDHERGICHACDQRFTK